MVLRPSDAIGSITVLTRLARSWRLKTLASPLAVRILQHLEPQERVVWSSSNWAQSCVSSSSKPTSRAGSQRPPCWTLGSCHQSSLARCSWTSSQSWRCRPWTVSLLGFRCGWSGSLGAGRGRVPVRHIRSCFPPGEAARPPSPEAAGSSSREDVKSQVFTFNEKSASSHGVGIKLTTAAAHDNNINSTAVTRHNFQQTQNR